MGVEFDNPSTNFMSCCFKYEDAAYRHAYDIQMDYLDSAKERDFADECRHGDDPNRFVWEVAYDEGEFCKAFSFLSKIARAHRHYALVVVNYVNYDDAPLIKKDRNKNY